MADAAVAAARYPVFGHEIVDDLTCVDWPVRAAMTPRTVSASGAAPILVVGTRRDPVTPYEWSQALAGMLSSGRLLSYDGDGHAAYARHTPCVSAAVDGYLLHGTLPAPGAVCSPS
jgi:pimeloyl-ACP methyl ester carboxylesterase